MSCKSSNELASFYGSLTARLEETFKITDQAGGVQSPGIEKDEMFGSRFDSLGRKSGYRRRLLLSSTI